MFAKQRTEDGRETEDSKRTIKKCGFIFWFLVRSTDI